MSNLEQLIDAYKEQGDKPLYTPGPFAWSAPEVSLQDVAQKTVPLIGATAGSIAGALLTRTPAGIQAGRTLGSRLGASLFSPTAVRQIGYSAGGAASGGLAGEQAVRLFTGQEPMSPEEAATTGLEFAAFDAAGNAVFRAGAEVLKIPLQYLGKNFSMAANQEKIKQAQEYLTKEKGTLTTWQAQRGGGLSMLEGVLRGTPTAAGVFERQAADVVNSLTVSRGKLLEQASNIAFDPTNMYTGMKQFVDSGANKLYDDVRPFYESLDRYNKKINIAPVIADAEAQLNRLGSMTVSGKPSQLGASEGVVGTLTHVTDLKPNQSFGDTHKLLSDLKAKIRDSSKEFGTNSQNVRILKDTVKQVEAAMDSTASNLFHGSQGTIFDQYKQVSKMYKENIQSLYSDGLAAAMHKNPDQIGSAIFSNTTSMNADDVHKALKTAKGLTKNDAEFTGIMGGLQRGFLEKMLGTAESELTETGLRASIASWSKNPTNKRIADIILTNDQKQGVNQLLNAADMASKLPSAQFSLFAASRQFSTGTSALGSTLQLGLAGVGAGGAYAAGQGDITSTLGAMATAGAVLLVPRVMAKIAANPRHVNRLLNIEGSVNKTGLTGATLSKLAGVLSEAGVTVEDLQQQQQQQTPENAELQGIINQFK